MHAKRWPKELQSKDLKINYHAGTCLILSFDVNECEGAGTVFKRDVNMSWSILQGRSKQFHSVEAIADQQMTECLWEAMPLKLASKATATCVHMIIDLRAGH